MIEVSGLFRGGTPGTATRSTTAPSGAVTSVCALALALTPAAELAIAATSIAPIILLAPFLFMLPPLGSVRVAVKKQTSWPQPYRFLRS
ncbi:hypothetical protein [Paraburkholderia sp.]|uniref:hypothetical protein n=1 Tax=Paraburkholderia sp. TaxID=1926495 RepID=UPI0025E1E29A|nr:hypothetical protein [Paraburkholderia sp.]